MSHYLGSQDMLVGHDIGIGCKSVKEFATKFCGTYDGSCETGSMFAWKLIRDRVPGVKFVVIRRPRDQVAQSLQRIGINDFDDELAERDDYLDEVECQPESVRIEFDDLSRPVAAQMIMDHIAPEIQFDVELFEKLNQINVQLNMGERFDRLRQFAPDTEALKADARAELATMIPGYRVEIEPWEAFWKEARPLAEAHSVEVDGGVEPRRRFKVDENQMLLMQRYGVLKVFALRKDGVLVGYLTWQMMKDVESEGLLIAQQGAWYVAPGHARGARKLFVESIATLRDKFQVQHIFPHHRTQGRGDSLGRFFARMGAKKIQETYSLWIGR